MSPAAKSRIVPRPFKYEWGAGQIVEEAAFSAEHHEPAIQLLEYQGSEHDGLWQIRFCFYNPRGMFQRSPMLVGADEIKGLRAALKKTPKLRRLLKKLVE
jgi:hypothetical protein